VADEAAIRLPCVFHPEDESAGAKLGAGVGAINGVRTRAEDVPDPREMLHMVELGSVASGVWRIDRDPDLVVLRETNDAVHAEGVIGVPAGLVVGHRWFAPASRFESLGMCEVIGSLLAWWQDCLPSHEPEATSP
jgi:hypothetical protein